LTDSL